MSLPKVLCLSDREAEAMFALHKLLLQTYLAAVVISCNEVKGKSALALPRNLAHAI